MLTAEGPCVPPRSYGAGCARHDLIHDPRCAMLDAFGGILGPEMDYCLRPWCYVDAVECRRSPSGRAYRSDYFPRDQGVDLFYSYTTCNSTADDWIYHEKQHLLGGVEISTVISDYMPPLVYKRDPAGDVLQVAGKEYYNSSVPFEGYLIKYLDKLMEIAGGDFTLNYTYGSEAGRRMHQGSSWTGAVQDVEDGVVDMAAGPLWITTKRLKMTSFTVPLYQDKTVLFIPRPGGDSLQSLKVSTMKVLEPFSLTLWGLAIALIAFTALISVWFSNLRFRQHNNPDRKKKKYYARAVIDEFLQKGIFFCSAGVEQDRGASLPQKLLMFGFGFFILILVSSYVANLAAFLTRPVDFIATMDDVIDKGLRVCTSNVFKTELEIIWPNVNFVFGEAGEDGVLPGLIDNFKAKKCDVIAFGKFDATHSLNYMETFCEEDLVFTDSPVLEKPIAFPIVPELATGLSYWIYKGEKNHGITFEAAEEEFDEYTHHVCDLEFSVRDYEASEFDQIGPKHLLFPIMFFLGFAILAILTQLYHLRTSSALVGRSSVLESSKQGGGIHPHFHFSSMQSLHSNPSKDDSEHQSLRYGNAAAATIVKGSITPDEINLDTESTDDGKLRVQTVKKRFLLDRTQILGNKEDTGSRANEEGAVGVSFDKSGNDATSRLRLLVETGVFDEFLDCVQEIKQQKDH